MNILRTNLTAIIFLQEIHDSVKNKNAWVSNFSCRVLSPHGAPNSCDVLTPNLGKKSLSSINRKQIKLEEFGFLVLP